MNLLQVCNGDDFVKVHKDDMRLVMGIFHGRFRAPLPGFELKNCPVNLRDLTLPSGVPLKLGPLPETVVDSVDLFFCCSTCGKIFWEGGHHKRVNAQFSYVLDSSQQQNPSQLSLLSGVPPKFVPKIYFVTFCCLTRE